MPEVHTTPAFDAEFAAAVAPVDDDPYGPVRPDEGHAHSERQDCDETCPAWRPVEVKSITFADLALAVARDGEFEAADEEDEAFALRLWSFLPPSDELARPSGEALRLRAHYERTVGTNGA